MLHILTILKGVGKFRDFSFILKADFVFGLTLLYWMICSHLSLVCVRTILGSYDDQLLNMSGYFSIRHKRTQIEKRGYVSNISICVG